jgi:ribose transport system substrate-binding protein
MSDNDGAFVPTRGTFINTVAAAEGAALFGRLGITPALAVEATGKAERPLKAAFSNADLQATWCAQGERAAEHLGRLFNINITWFDPEWMLGAAKVKPPAVH